jgi:CHAT domain-containing protein
VNGRLVVVSIAITVIGMTGRPVAQEAVTREDLTVSPHHLLHGSRDMVERVDRHFKLAAIAERDHDYPRAAMHYALGCQARAAFRHDASLLEAPECRRARALARDHDILDVKVQMQVAEGTTRAWQLDAKGAIEALRQAIAMGAALNPDDPDNSAIIGAHSTLGTMLFEVGQYDAALRETIYSRDHCRAAGNSICAAYSDIWLCRMYANIGNFATARAACDAANAEAAVDNDVLVVGTLGWMRGNLEAAVGRYDASLLELRRAWDASHGRGAATMQAVVAPLIVDALIKLDRLDEAESWQRAIEGGLREGRVPANFGPAIAARRGQLALARGKLREAEASFAIGATSAVHEVSIRSYLAGAKVARMRHDSAAARRSLESAIQKIENGRSSLSGSALRASYLMLHADAYRDLIGVRFESEGAAAAPAALDIAESGRARALLDQLSSAQVAGAQAATLRADAVQAALGADEVLVEYVSSTDALYAITVMRDRVSITPLPMAGGESELERRVDFFNTLAQESDETALLPSSRRLYADVLAPALADVPPSAKTLIIAADGPLHRLPFDALGDATRVIDRWNVVMVPSASMLVRTPRPDRRAGPALVVAASPTSADLAPLAAAPQEAAAIRRRISGTVDELSGAAATKAQLQAQGLERFTVLHFASHAVVDEERPLRSALILANGDGDDGRWTAEEIYRSKLSADLVVLSACSTAAGATAPGEGVMSLSRAFLYAGAGATIATLWNVPDANGPVFADALYRALAAGQPLGIAAADARRALRKQGAPPRAWAAYVVTGSPDARVRIVPPAKDRTLTAALGGGLVVALMLGTKLLLSRQ